MRLCKTWIEGNPDDASRIRVFGEVEYDDLGRERIWYDFDESLEPWLDRSGSPWLVALLPVAMTLGESLTLCEPADAKLLENIQQLISIWSTWYPELKPVAFHAEAYSPTRKDSRCAAFFSGGVDSLFTILRRNDVQRRGDAKLPNPGVLDDLLCLWGFDIPLNHPVEFARMRNRFREAAAQLGCQFIDVASNLRESRFQRAKWAELSHASGLASFGLFLGPRLRAVLLGSAFDYRSLRPWGSHPLTDVLASTSMTQVIHDGAECTRFEKTRYLAESDFAMRYLRVCWKHGSDLNCGNCNKCYRTMVSLELLNALERCQTFDAAQLDLSRVRRIYSDSDAARSFFEGLHTLAVERGRIDVANALTASLRFSARIERAIALGKRMDHWPYVWRFSDRIKWRAMAHAII